MKYLQNDRITLRAPEPEDLELLYQWENNPEWWNLGSTLVPFSRYQLKSYIAEAHRDIFDIKQLRLMVDSIEEGKTVGMVDLYDFDPHHQRAGVGVLIDSIYQKKGFGSGTLTLLVTYAFSFLKLHQLYAHISVENEASKKLFTRCNFVQTGVLKDWITTTNGYVDVITMQRLNEVK